MNRQQLQSTLKAGPNDKSTADTCQIALLVKLLSRLVQVAFGVNDTSKGQEVGRATASTSGRWQLSRAARHRVIFSTAHPNILAHLKSKWPFPFRILPISTSLFTPNSSLPPQPFLLLHSQSTINLPIQVRKPLQVLTLEQVVRLIPTVCFEKQSTSINNYNYKQLQLFYNPQSPNGSHSSSRLCNSACGLAQQVATRMCAGAEDKMSPSDWHFTFRLQLGRDPVVPWPAKVWSSAIMRVALPSWAGEK